MKKKWIIIIFILLVIIISSFIGLRINSKNKRKILQDNQQYEQYLEKEIYGTEVVTLINKAMNSNEINHIEKDEKGMYIDNHQMSILIDIMMITNEDTGETTTYRMESIVKVGITEFIKNFNSAKFQCIQKRYHTKTGKIAYIKIKQKTI